MMNETVFQIFIFPVVRQMIFFDSRAVSVVGMRKVQWSGTLCNDREGVYPHACGGLGASNGEKIWSYTVKWSIANKEK